MTYSIHYKPAVLYTSETITWKKDLMQMIEVWMTQTRFVDHISLADLRNSTGIESI